MKKYFIFLILIVVAYFCFLFYSTNNKQEQIIISHNVIERSFPVFRMASYQINYTGRIYVNGTDRIVFNIPTGGYTVRIDYDAEILIGTKTHPRVNMRDNIIELDFTDVRLEVLAVTPTRMELVNSGVSGWRWVRGGGIPIQAGLFDPFIETINNAPEVLNYNEEIQQRALESLIQSFLDFYSIFNFEVEIVN